MNTLSRTQQEKRLKTAWDKYREQERKHGQTSPKALAAWNQAKRYEREDANY